ncbi:peroxidase-like [Amphibalanus amphitrite]|uniref:peroxidase-like n=1 Tax=Amphibalanus amphitrite TaxID=1232801 RepID=UPI001C914E2A|nr:peroxidase-like [Amphibalanus amphitrite]XP_043199373.1 peroxidase-like [Amphibalanus amphitrite]
MRLLILTCLVAAAGRASGQVCVSPIECKSLDNLQELLASTGGAGFPPCDLSDGSQGVLCSTPAEGDIANRFGGAAAAPAAPGGDSIFFPGQGQGGAKVNVLDVQPLTSRFKQQQELLISAAQEEANLIVTETEQQLAEVEREVAQLSQAQANTPEGLQLLFAKPQSKEVGVTARSSIKAVQVLKSLQEKKKVGTKELQFEQPLFGADIANRGNFQRFPAGLDRIPGCTLPEQPACQPREKFRRMNGECNSDAEPRLGRAQTAFSRFFPAEYEDGIWQPRSKALSGDPLPSARLVSERVVRTTPVMDPWSSLSVMQLGQILNHDIISTAAFTLENGGGLFCCNRDNTMPAEPLHPLGCNPIPVPADDPWYAQFGRTCMNQVRSLPAPFENCIAGPTGQLNQVTHFLDLSTVYGSSDTDMRRLRLNAGGLFKMSDGNLLPQSGGRFISGEGRLSENPGLAFMHTVWTREHNRVANTLSRLHRHWSDEQLFQEARRIVIGEYQHIIYNEYLPVILGFKYTREHGLDPEFGHSFSYTNVIDPRVTAEFSTAAFRFGHAQIPDVFQLMTQNGMNLTAIAMEDSFFREDMLKLPNFMTNLATTLTRQKQRMVDNTFSPAVHEKLFASGQPSGLDLIALNINRGRDHGLPGYATVLENCLERTLSGGWDEMSEFFEPDVLRQLRAVYQSVFDIDLYIGGVSEKKVPGALVGPAFQCIIGEQFFATRYGDRYFYDNGDMPHSLTFTQVREIQKASWARILCDNVEDVNVMQPLAFFAPNPLFNAVRHCRSFAIPTVDLRAF